ESRVVLKIPPALAPVKVAVFPLVKKDGLPEKAKEIYKTLRLIMNTQYEEKDSIGRRYRRQDAIGTPYSITVDHQTIKDNTVTVRHRDSMKQKRVAVDILTEYIFPKVDINKLLEKLT
ncbi:MAG TPA: glycine--tRNA ligase, partial [Bacteroidales bacterium]|nr:glycine--tRNA ligase [Bacteroidales bacterium]